MTARPAVRRVTSATGRATRAGAGTRHLTRVRHGRDPAPDGGGLLAVTFPNDEGYDELIAVRADHEDVP